MPKKRFHDIEIWTQDWFTELPKAYMFFWMYLKDSCDHAGIWKPNKKIFEFLIEEKIQLNKALELFNRDKERVIVLKNNDWLLVDFFSFQYGHVMNLGNRVHKSVYDRYKELGINLNSIRGLIDLKDGAKDKEKDREKDIGKGYGLKDRSGLFTHTLQKYVSENLPIVSKIEKQLSVEECEKLLKDFPEKSIKEKLDAMENYKGLEKKYVSVYRTLLTWLKKDAELTKTNWTKKNGHGSRSKSESVFEGTDEL